MVRQLQVVDFIKWTRLYYFAPILKMVRKNIPAPDFKYGFFCRGTGSNYHNQADKKRYGLMQYLLLAEGTVNASLF